MEQLTEIIKRLCDAKVEFSLIGGLASRHYGVSLVTEDVNICARFTPENLRRIETANKLPLELTDELCASLKNIYLTTDLGILDCLSQVAGVGDFDAILKQSTLKDFPVGQCYVINIDALIEAKKAVGRPHDLIAVSQLQAIKEQKKQQKELF